jgi:hypothetical protein
LFFFLFFVNYLFFSPLVGENFQSRTLNGNLLKRVQDAKIRARYNCTLYVHFIPFFIFAFLFFSFLHLSLEFFPVIADCETNTSINFRIIL